MRRASVVATLIFITLCFGTATTVAAPIDGIHNIQHVIVIMQENRSCVSALEGPPNPDNEPDPYQGSKAKSLPWTDVTYLLHKHNVSWGYYIFEGDEPDCEDDEAMTCAPTRVGVRARFFVLG